MDMGAYNAAAGFGTAKIEKHLAFYFAAILAGNGMYFVIFNPKSSSPNEQPRRTRGLGMIMCAACITALYLTKK